MLLADFFYNGVARWQLGFDNPNKAAVLAVELILVGLALVAATRRLVLRALGAVLTVGSLYVLLHTFSRGGMVALAVAAVPLAIGFLRYLKGTRTFVRVCFLVIAVAFCLLSVRMGTSDDWYMGFQVKTVLSAIALNSGGPFLGYCGTRRLDGGLENRAKSTGSGISLWIGTNVIARWSTAT